MTRSDEFLTAICVQWNNRPTHEDHPRAKRWCQAWNELLANARAYLNEKPHEPPQTMPMYPSGYAEQLREASPPHAAAEPEKPVAWWSDYPNLPLKNDERSAYLSCVEIPGALPLYASPSAQPIARDEQDAKRYRWLREFWIWADNVDAEGHPREKVAISGARTDGLDEIIDAALKSAGKEST